MTGSLSSALITAELEDGALVEEGEADAVRLAVGLGCCEVSDGLGVAEALSNGVCDEVSEALGVSSGSERRLPLEQL